MPGILRTFLCCLGNRARVFVRKTNDASTQTDTDDKVLKVDVYSSDFESSTSPYPSPKRKRSPIPFVDENVFKAI